MGGRLELARFGFYVLFPTTMMMYFTDPDWYNKYVHPFRHQFLRPDLQGKKLPQSPQEAREELAKLRAQREQQQNEKKDRLV